MASWIMLEYLCQYGTRVESLEDRAAPSAAVRCRCCGGLAERTMSAPAVKVPLVSVRQAGREDPKPPPGTISTRDIGDGKPVHQWRADRSARRRRERRDALHRALKD
jgi:hypothetical protein